jgi:hypothetical protein
MVSRNRGRKPVARPKNGKRPNATSDAKISRADEGYYFLEFDCFLWALSSTTIEPGHVNFLHAKLFRRSGFEISKSRIRLIVGAIGPKGVWSRSRGNPQSQ